MIIKAVACREAVYEHDIRGIPMDTLGLLSPGTLAFPSILDAASAAGASSPRLHSSVTPAVAPFKPSSASEAQDIIVDPLNGLPLYLGS
jgi:hypothetical protein